MFLVEMWERFSFYVMNALFVLYMTDKDNGHPFLQRNYSLIYGSYLGAVYFTPFPFGIWADRQLGYRQSILLGAIIMGLGHVLLAINGLEFFFAGLLFLVIGNGLFKPNISTLVGYLYQPNDPRLDSAYTIFYMGINLGAFFAPIVAGTVRVFYGYHLAFGIAGLGMAISLVLFLLLESKLVFQKNNINDYSDDAVCPKEQSDKNIALLIIFILVTLFWISFKQNGNTLSLWFRNNTDRQAPEWWPAILLDMHGEITTEYVSSINPLFVILFSPLLILFWNRLRSIQMEPSTPAKIGFAMFLTAVAFAILAVGGISGGDEGRVSAAYILGAYATITVAELCLSPIGLSLVSKLAARERRSMWMGGWFAATAIGGYVSGFLGQYWDSWPHSTFFSVLVCCSMIALLMLLIFYSRLVAAIPPSRSTKV